MTFKISCIVQRRQDQAVFPSFPWLVPAQAIQKPNYAQRLSDTKTGKARCWS